MTAQGFFQATNTLALAAWIALVLLPAKQLVSGWLCAIVVPGVLALAYAVVIGWKLAVNGPPPGDVMTLSGLREVFSDDWVFAAAWTHYLVFDMVVGAWIARDSVKLGLPWILRTIALALTFLAGPAGFLVHLAGRWGLRRAVAVCEYADESSVALTPTFAPADPRTPAPWPDPARPDVSCSGRP